MIVPISQKRKVRHRDERAHQRPHSKQAAEPTMNPSLPDTQTFLLDQLSFLLDIYLFLTVHGLFIAVHKVSGLGSCGM